MWRYPFVIAVCTDISCSSGSWNVPRPTDGILCPVLRVTTLPAYLWRPDPDAIDVAIPRVKCLLVNDGAAIRRVREESLGRDAPRRAAFIAVAGWLVLSDRHKGKVRVDSLCVLKQTGRWLMTFGISCPICYF